MGDIMHYLDRINERLTDKDITAKNLSEKLEKNYSNILKTLKGNNGRYFSIEDLIEICKLTNTSPEYILGFTNEIKPINEEVNK